jgi:hypothetical protein
MRVTSRARSIFQQTSWLLGSESFQQRYYRHGLQFSRRAILWSCRTTSALATAALCRFEAASVAGTMIKTRSRDVGTRNCPTMQMANDALRSVAVP